jgi:hypothetical protein
MDVSENYIKMCEKAAEVQDRKPKNIEFTSNVYFGQLTLESRPVPHLFTISDPLLVDEDSVWLPRQDQLQEMVIYKSEDKTLKYRMWMLVTEFDIWKNGKGCSDTYESLEQLWLAFVMKENYQKVWNGEDWVKE